MEWTLPAYIIAGIEVDDPSLLKDYQVATSPIIQKYHGRCIARGNFTVTLEGPVESRSTVHIEFHKLSDAEAFYHSHEYTEARKLR